MDARQRARLEETTSRQEEQINNLKAEVGMYDRVVSVETDKKSELLHVCILK